MTSEAQRNAGYLLPANVTGHDLMMVCLCIPDTQEYRAAFRGAVYELTKPWNWQAIDETEYPRQHEAARYWTEIYHEYLNMPCNICELMAGCIEAILNTPYDELSPGLQALHDALSGWLEKNGNNLSGTPSISSLYNDDMNIIALPGCDLDNLFAAITGLVDFLHRAIWDLAELIEASTSNMEIIKEVISAIPVVGLLPIDELFALADQLLSNIGDNYLGAYTAAIRDEYRCALFCMAKTDCELTFKEMFDYFANRANATIRDVQFSDYVEMLLQGPASGEELVHVAHALFAGVLAFGSSWMGIQFDYLTRVVQALYNDTDPDWSILCPCVAEYDVSYIWEPNDAKGWTVVAGVWISGVNPYLYSYPSQPGGHHVMVERYFQSFDGLEALYALDSRVQVVNTYEQYGVHIRITHSSGEFQGYWEGAVSQTTPFILPSTLNGVSYISVVVREDLVADGGNARLGGVRLTGTSYNQPPAPPD